MSEQITGTHVSIEFDARNPEKDVFREVDLRVRRHMSRDAKLTYAQAVHAVFIDDVPLHRRYLKTVPPVHPSRGGTSSA